MRLCQSAVRAVLQKSVCASAFIKMNGVSVIGRFWQLMAGRKGWDWQAKVMILVVRQSKSDLVL